MARGRLDDVRVRGAGRAARCRRDVGDTARRRIGRAGRPKTPGSNSTPDTAPPPATYGTAGPGVHARTSRRRPSARAASSRWASRSPTARAFRSTTPARTRTGAVNAKWVLSWLGNLPRRESGRRGRRRAARVHRLHDAGSRERERDEDRPAPRLRHRGDAHRDRRRAGNVQYTFGTKLPTGFDGTKTHTVGVWATRVFGGLTYVVNTLYDFVPERRHGDGHAQHRHDAGVQPVPQPARLPRG